jgi:hypothetical protein
MAEEEALLPSNEPEEEQAAAEAQQHEEEESQEQEEQQQEEEDEPRDPGSSMVASIAYNRDAEELEAVFQNGRSESYSITPAQWEDLKEAPSAGKWMWANVL